MVTCWQLRTLRTGGDPAIAVEVMTHVSAAALAANARTDRMTCTTRLMAHLVRSCLNHDYAIDRLLCNQVRLTLSWRGLAGCNANLT
jgi:hypothetical protein